MKASVFIATSLDGFIARRDGGIDWLPEPELEGQDYEPPMAAYELTLEGHSI